tara:strand:+ start:30278 stop:30799 length:522 start_codon:yes stop_codon:yes gene_type:complete
MSSEVLASYSPEDVAIVISAGDISHVINGYVDGTFVNITRLVLGSEPYSGADVTNARVVRSNKNASVTLSLAQFSESNDILSQLLQLDSQTRDDTWLFSLTIKDNSGRSVYFCRQCYIGGHPDSSFSNSIDSRDWMIHCVKLEQTIGGNGQFSPSTADELTSINGVVEDRWLP